MFLATTAMCAPARCASRAISRCAAASSICGRRAGQPLRLDFSARARTPSAASTPRRNCRRAGRRIELLPASEVPFDDASISRFRTGYVAAFGPASDDPLYETVSAGARRRAWSIGCRCSTADGYIVRFRAARALMLGHHIEEAKAARLELVADYYETRRQFLNRRRASEAG